MIANIRAKLVDGDLVFHNAIGTEIARFDDSAGTLDISGIAIDGTVVTATATEINKLASSGAVVASGTQAELITDLGDSATGAEIATAVNSIIDVLQAFSIVATS